MIHVVRGQHLVNEPCCTPLKFHMIRFLCLVKRFKEDNVSHDVWGGGGGGEQHSFLNEFKKKD